MKYRTIDLEAQPVGPGIAPVRVLDAARQSVYSLDVLRLSRSCNLRRQAVEPDPALPGEQVLDSSRSDGSVAVGAREAGRTSRSSARLRRASPFVAPALLCWVMAGPGVSPGDHDPGGSEPSGARRARFLMGTRLSIEVFPAGGQTVFERAFHEVDRLEQVMSNWRDDSEVARLNRRGARTSFRCSADLFQAVAAAIDWARETGGAFDPTIEPRVRQLGLRGDDGRLPGRGETSALRRFGAATIAPVGWRLVTMDRPTRSIRFARMGMGLDLGGIGKGIALDAASAILRGEGVSSALLDFGGQVQAFGPGPGGRGWPVGIADPDDRGKAVASLLLRDASLATSGNGERRGPRETGATGHILDPQRGVPADFHGSVVVLSTDGTTADALSTALFVMGPERGLDWAERREVAALYLWRSPQGRLEHRATKPFHERLAVWEDDDVTEAGGGFRARGDPTKQENPCGGGP